MPSIKLADLDALDVFTNGPNDQPTTCPKCSYRTDYIQIEDNKQQHKCIDCRYEFFLDFE